MIFSQNSYRVLGVVSNSGVKEIKKNISKLKAFSKIGKEVAFDFDLSFLNLATLDRAESSLLQSENSLNMDKNKITNSLFWFTDLSSVDSVALANLIKGDTAKSIEIFEKATKSNEVTSKNYSSFNNLSTLLLLTSLDESRTDTFKKDDTSIQRIRKALELKSLFLSSTLYNTYCEEICRSVALDSASAQDFFTTSILDLLNKNFNTKEISSLFDGLDNHLKEKLSDTLTEAPLSNVKSHIESANELIKSDEKSGSKVGKKLIKDTRKDFTHLKDVLGVDDFQFQTLSDQLSNQIMQCGIVCFNSTGDDQDYLSSYKYALSIAIGDKTKERAKECVKHCEEVKVANLCSYCEEESIDNSASYSTIIYKETNRTWFPRRVEFKQATLNLYYCKSCYKKIMDKDKIQQRVAIGGVILGVIFAGFISPNAAHDSDSILPLFLFIGAMLGFFGYKLGSGIGSNFGSYTIIKWHPNLKEHIQQGWQLSQPTA